MIDWDRVRELRADIGEEDFAEVVELFLDETERAIEGMGDAADPAELSERLHFLKGSALNLGFAALGELCEDGQRAAAQGRAPGPGAAQIEDVYRRSRARLLSGL